jgi:hypothetical protein
MKVMESAMMDAGFDLAGVAHEKRLDEAVQRILRLAEPGGSDDTPAADHASGSAGLSREQTLDAMYESAADIRLDLIYCPTLSGHLRKRWSNRLGEINLRAASAAAEIHHLRDDLRAYEAYCEESVAVDVAKFGVRLRQLRELCVRHLGFRAR